MSGDSVKVLKLGPLWFQPGITGWNFVTLAYGSFSTISLVIFISFIQPYLLTEILHMPASEQGTFTGLLHSLQEALTILLTGFIGALSDRSGRRKLFALGFAIMAFGYLLMPLSESATQLIIFRCLFAIGAAMVPIMMLACHIDYIQDRSLGRWIGVTAILTGAGAVFMAIVLVKTPEMFLNAGADAVAAGRYAYWVGAAMCLLSATLLWLGLSNQKPAAPERSEVWKQLYAGIRAGLDNPKLMLSYFAAFIGRGDLVIISVFFSLWITQDGADAGIGTAEALARAGIMFGIIQLSAMVWAPLIGMIADRVNRVTALAFGLSIGAVGYFWMGQVEDPFGSGMLPAAILLGIGEISVIISANTLMGQEAAPNIRGAIVGVYGLMGGLGIIAATAAGGIAFDQIGRTAPFTMMAILNALLMLVALVVRARARS
ncbi:MAG: MFS family permease [Gammaproteobacteria bacterium]